MTTYWDLVPRDIWRMVLDYVAPKIFHHQKWHKFQGLTTEPPSIQTELEVLMAWISDQVKDPLTYLVEYYFGAGIYLATTLEALNKCVLAFQKAKNSIIRLEYALQMSRPALYQRYYDYWLDFYLGHQDEPIFGKNYFSNPWVGHFYTRRTEAPQFHSRMLLAVALSNSSETRLWWEQQGIPVSGSVLAPLLTADLVDRMTDSSILWLAALFSTDPPLLALVKVCISSFRKVVPQLLLRVRLNLPELLRSNWRSLPSSCLTQLFRQVIPDLSIDRLTMITTMEVALTTLGWDVAVQSALQLPLSRLHGLIMYVIAQPVPIVLLHALYQAFFRSLDAPERFADLFYCSYQELKASRHWSASQSLLQPFLSEALQQGRLWKTKHFP